MTQVGENAPQCMEDVGEPPGYWHSHRCTRRAKFRTNKAGHDYFVCTQHAKWYARWGGHPVVLIEAPPVGRSPE